MRKKRVRPTKTKERAALLKERRRVHRKLIAKKRARGGGLARKTKSHPHRKATALRGRR